MYTVLLYVFLPCQSCLQEVLNDGCPCSSSRGGSERERRGSNLFKYQGHASRETECFLHHMPSVVPLPDSPLATSSSFSEDEIEQPSILDTVEPVRSENNRAETYTSGPKNGPSIFTKKNKKKFQLDLKKYNFIIFHIFYHNLLKNVCGK